MTTTPVTFMDLLLILAGVVNLLGDRKVAYPDVNAEQGFAFDPQAILRNSLRPPGLMH